MDLSKRLITTQNKMHSAKWLVRNGSLSAKAREIEKNPDITTLATKASLSAIATDWE